MPAATALAAAVALLPATAPPDRITCVPGSLSPISGTTPSTPRAHDVITGGPVDRANCPRPGYGQIGVAPVLAFIFTEIGAGRAMKCRVQGSCDTLMLVNDTATGWHFNDDDSGPAPRFRLDSAGEGSTTSRWHLRPPGPARRR